VHIRSAQRQERYPAPCSPTPYISSCFRISLVHFDRWKCQSIVGVRASPQARRKWSWATVCVRLDWKSV
jgi:hypothetical protein